MRRWWIAASAAALAICFAIAFTRGIGADYGNLDCHLRDAYCDDAQPALDGLIHGDLQRFFDQQPLMGPVSLVLRAPVVALAGLDHYDATLVYRLGALACLLVLAAVALWTAAIIRDRGRPVWQQALTGVLILANPAVFWALNLGHPEELVVTALCIAVVLALIRGHNVLAGVLVGAALASKPWAILIVPAAAIVLADRKVLLRATAAAAIVLVVAYAPMAIGNFDRLSNTAGAANKLGTLPGSVTSANVWWFVGSEKVTFNRAVRVEGTRVVTQPEVGYVLRDGVAHVTHPAVVLLAAVFALLWARDEGRRRRPDSLLLLFALTFFMRCVLDPGNSSYYHQPAVACLAAYEGLATRRPPWATLWLIGWLEAMSRVAAPHIHSDVGFGLFYLAWAVPTLIGLAIWVFRPENDASERPRRGGAPVALPSTGS